MTVKIHMGRPKTAENGIICRLFREPFDDPLEVLQIRSRDSEIARLEKKLPNMQTGSARHQNTVARIEKLQRGIGRRYIPHGGYFSVIRSKLKNYFEDIDGKKRLSIRYYLDHLDMKLSERSKNFMEWYFYPQEIRNRITDDEPFFDQLNRILMGLAYAGLKLQERKLAASEAGLSNEQYAKLDETPGTDGVNGSFYSPWDIAARKKKEVFDTIILSVERKIHLDKNAISDKSIKEIKDEIFRECKISMSEVLIRDIICSLYLCDIYFDIFASISKRYSGINILEFIFQIEKRYEVMPQ